MHQNAYPHLLIQQRLVFITSKLIGSQVSAASSSGWATFFERLSAIMWRVGGCKTSHQGKRWQSKGDFRLSHVVWHAWLFKTTRRGRYEQRQKAYAFATHSKYTSELWLYKWVDSHLDNLHQCSSPMGTSSMSWVVKPSLNHRSPSGTCISFPLICRFLIRPSEANVQSSNKPESRHTARPQVLATYQVRSTGTMLS